jgi:hypothetical protein
MHAYCSLTVVFVGCEASYLNCVESLNVDAFNLESYVTFFK